MVLFTYLNPIYAYGFERFLADAAAAGADGLLILDLPPDEAEQNAELVFSGGLDPIRLIAPTTPAERMAKIVSTAQRVHLLRFPRRSDRRAKPSFRYDLGAGCRASQAHGASHRGGIRHFNVRAGGSCGQGGGCGGCWKRGRTANRRECQRSRPCQARRRLHSTTCASHEVRLALPTHATLLHQNERGGQRFRHDRQSRSGACLGCRAHRAGFVTAIAG